MDESNQTPQSPVVAFPGNSNPVTTPTNQSNLPAQMPQQVSGQTAVSVDQPMQSATVGVSGMNNTPNPVMAMSEQTSQGQQNAPVIQTSQQSDIPSNNHHADASGDDTFSSNPFRALGKGLAMLYSVNPQSGITITLFAMIVGFLYMIASISPFFGPAIYIILMLVTVVVGIIVFIRIYLGTLLLFEKSKIGEEITAKEAFNNGVKGKLGKLITASLVAIIPVILGFLLFIIPGLILLARLSLMPFVVYNEDIGGVKAFKRSLALTKKHTFEMFGAMFAGNIASGNGLIGPVVSQASLANRYYELVEIENGTKTTSKVHPWNYVLTLIPIIIVVFFIAFFAFIANSVSNSSQDYEFNNDSFFETREGNSIFDQYCEPTNEFYEFYEDNCVDGKYIFDIQQQ